MTLERVPGARWASVTSCAANVHHGGGDGRGGGAGRHAAYELGDGPCVDAVLKNSLFVTGQVRTDPRWEHWGRRVSAEAGVHSVLAQRLHLHNQYGAVAGLNLYSAEPDAFDGQRWGSR